MKTQITLYISCLLLSCSLQAFSSLQVERLDTIETEIRGIEFDRSEHDGHSQYALRMGMLDLGISSYLSENGGLDMPNEIDYMDQRLLRSINLGIHLVNIKLGLHKKGAEQKFGISSGLRWNIVHYSMEKDYNLVKDAANYEAAIDNNVPALKKNRLKANYVQIPFLLEFNSNPNCESQSFNISVGYVHQLLLNSNYKYKTETGDKSKTSGGYNMTKSMGLLEGRIGYGPLNFYFQYGLKNLFQDNSDPILTPVNFGVNIIPR